LLAILLGRKNKEIVFSKTQKDSLLKKASLVDKKGILELDLPAKKELAQENIANISKNLFSMLIQSDLNEKEVFDQFDKLKISKNAKNLLKKQYRYHIFYEKKYPIYHVDNKIYMELLRNVVFTFSDSSRKDIARPVQEMVVDKEKPVFAVKQLIYNGLLALQFGEISIAKKKYREAMEIYDHLPKTDQNELFAVLEIFFEHINYIAKLEK
jgi:hypothetical protein